MGLLPGAKCQEAAPSPCGLKCLECSAGFLTTPDAIRHSVHVEVFHHHLSCERQVHSTWQQPLVVALAVMMFSARNVLLVVSFPRSSIHLTWSPSSLQLSSLSVMQVLYLVQVRQPISIGY